MYFNNLLVKGALWQEIVTFNKCPLSSFFFHCSCAVALWLESGLKPRFFRAFLNCLQVSGGYSPLMRDGDWLVPLA